MITLFVGHRDTARTLLHKEVGNKTVTTCVDADHPIEEVQSFLEQQPLFSQVAPVVLDGVLTTYPDVLEIILKSSLDVYVVEDSLSKDVLKRFVTHGAVVHTCKPSTVKKDTADVFAFTSWYEKKKKREAWVALIEAIEKGAAPEALHGLLFWKVKDLFQKKQADAALVREVAAMPGVVRKRGVALQEALETFILR
jgi:hypothetical protein